MWGNQGYGKHPLTQLNLTEENETKDAKLNKTHEKLTK